MGRDSGECVGVRVEVFNRVGGEHGDLASSELARTNKGNACIWYSSLRSLLYTHTRAHTHAHTHSLAVFLFFLPLQSLFCCVHNRLLLNLFGVPSTNADLREEDFYNRRRSVNGQSRCKTRIFVSPQVIEKKSVLYCQNHLPSHPHFLP